MGGIQDLLISIVGIFVFPYSEFMYNLKALQKLYLVRTIDPNLIYSGSMNKQDTNKVKFQAKKLDMPTYLKNTDLE